MSTSYYALRDPVASVYVGAHTCDLYNDIGGLVGSLHPTALHLAADRDAKVAHRSNGAITVYATGPDDQQAISEYGDLVTLGQLWRGEAP